MLNLKKLLTKILIALPRFYGITVTNVDTLTKFGFGYTNSATGTPSGTGNGMILVFPADTNGTLILQLYLPYANAKIYVRKYASGAWLSWAEN